MWVWEKASGLWSTRCRISPFTVKATLRVRPQPTAWLGREMVYIAKSCFLFERPFRSSGCTLWLFELVLQPGVLPPLRWWCFSQVFLLLKFIAVGFLPLTSCSCTVCPLLLRCSWLTDWLRVGTWGGGTRPAVSCFLCKSRLSGSLFFCFFLSLLSFVVFKICFFYLFVSFGWTTTSECSDLVYHCIVKNFTVK